jgi:hypothetical protein
MLKQWTAEDFEPSRITRFCDIVMKGGVTSGIVYPLAICRLASKYAIKNIGGTSVGAIAAAITAAAEYQRRTNGSGNGYIHLANLPAVLTQKGALQNLFTADPGGRIFLNAALKFTGSAPIAVKIAMAVIQFWWPTLIAGTALYWALYYILFGIIGGADSVHLHWAAGALMLVLLLPATATIYFIACKWRLDHNDFGLAHGPPLIDWLHAFIQNAAGRSTESAPLTFGDLWETHDPDWYAEHRSGQYGIDFRMVTTCLTLARPFELPFDPSEPIGLVPDPVTAIDNAGKPRPDLYFKRVDMERLFAPHIVAQLLEHGAAHSVHREYIRFPAAHAVPLIVATRLSMSFPILFTAVKLYATDVNGEMQPVWFSDGGLTSNFPIHFFDSPLPRWPTFAIDLLQSDPTSSHQDTSKYRDGAVFLESEHQPGTINPWNRFGKGEGSTIGFLNAILDTARNWLDETSTTLPGNSSRTIGIRLKPDEGGVNLAMSPPVMQGLFEIGETAGQRLVELFAPLPDTAVWQNQRWYRYRGAMGSLTRWLKGFETGYAGLSHDPQTKYADLFTPERFAPARIASAIAATASVAQLHSEWQRPPNVDPQFDDATEPRPIPVFAQRRPL